MLNSELKLGLETVLRAHDLLYGAVLDVQGQLLAVAGERGNFGVDGLVSQLLGPRGSAAVTYSLVGENELVRPAMLSEGDEFAFLEKVGEVMVVLFGRERGPAVQHIQLGREVAHSIGVSFDGGR